MSNGMRAIEDVSFTRFTVDLCAHSVSRERIACTDLEDLLGGIGRGFKLLELSPTSDAYAPEARLVMNLGILSGTSLMTGLRTFFHAYSPLKRSDAGKPSAMWSAGSGKFGTKLRFLGVDEVIFTGRSPEPCTLRLSAPEPGGEVEFHFEDAGPLRGRTTNEKIQALYTQYPEAHFAVIGPAGEHYEAVRYAAIALSTENQLKSGDAKARYCGRGGMGGVMGSKNLLAIVADSRDRKLEPAAANFKTLNRVVGTGEGSRRFRDAKTGGVGGTWANTEALNPFHAMPEYNFAPSGTEVSVPLYRSNVEALPGYSVKAESCFRCGIRCHKNLYQRRSKDGTKTFRAKFDYEPLVLLSSNLGIFDVESICELIELIDQLGLDAISCGVTLGYVMEWNREHENDDRAIAGGIAFGDFEGTRTTIEAIGRGELELLGRGTLRLSEELGATDYAMHSKGMEYPAYLPQTNPGYPWALAGGHMSMRTYLLLVNDRETGIDYWVDAITKPEKGLSMLLGDLVGTCKFAGLNFEQSAESVRIASGVPVEAEDLIRAVERTFLRGYRLEKTQGFVDDDYRMPARVLREHPEIDLPYFITPQFFEALRSRVLEIFDTRLDEEGL